MSVIVTACFATIPRPNSNLRIIGGEPANITNFPYQVAMEVNISIYQGLNCGGSIISQDWVLLAAHCLRGFVPSEVKIRAGSSYIGSGGSLHSVSEIISHPQFGNHDYDIGLIKVTEPFAYSDSVQPITMTTTAPSTGTSVTLSGWGDTSFLGEYSSQLQQVQVYIVDHDECNKDYEPYGGITPRMICAGAPEGGKDSCEGDSGGPAVSAGILVGVISWGNGCAFKGYPGIYANVAELRGWVTNITGIN